jgi:hypothetical protein
VSTIRTKKDKDNPYVMLNQGFLNDPALDWDTRGLLAYLLSKPDNWEIHTDHLIKQGKAGRTAMLRILRDLEAAGYLVRIRERDESGRFVWTKEVYEKPQSEIPPMGKPSTAKPKAERPTVYKRKNQVNTESTNESSQDDSGYRRNAEQFPGWIAQVQDDD